MSDNTAAQPGAEEDAMAAEWAAALAETKGEGESVAMQVQADAVAPAAFANFAPSAGGGAGNDINMILDIPVQLTVELGRTRIPIKHILQLAQGEVVVVNEKFGIRLTDIVTPSERMRRLSKGA